MVAVPRYVPEEAVPPSALAEPRWALVVEAPLSPRVLEGGLPVSVAPPPELVKRAVSVGAV